MEINELDNIFSECLLPNLIQFQNWSGKHEASQAPLPISEVAKMESAGSMAELFSITVRRGHIEPTHLVRLPTSLLGQQPKPRRRAHHKVMHLCDVDNEVFGKSLRLPKSHLP